MVLNVEIFTLIKMTNVLKNNLKFIFGGTIIKIYRFLLDDIFFVIYIGVCLYNKEGDEAL